MKVVFSIITIVLNDPDGLRKTANSIASQKLKKYKWIVVDGGSNDETLSVLDDFDLIDPIVHSEKDYGIYDAMNKGI
ncbi:MAG TPA: glycosyltransferase, partial [Leucothrix mucor]|nr:glycosyltransferase [Leucothrix mucor]